MTHTFPQEAANATARRRRFAETGYLVLPGFLPDTLLERLLPEVDRWVDEGLRDRSIAACLDPHTHGTPPVLELDLPAHGELLTHEPLMNVLSDLMGTDFVFHHLHSDRHGTTTGGKPWHHDHEPNDRADQSLLMVHALHYPAGLDPTLGHLAVLPGSHREHAAKEARAYLGTERIPGEVVIDQLPAGSTVLMNSALFHARRPARPGRARSRYFVDASYCQAGARWQPVKPYWRHMLARARELGLGRGRWPELFSEQHFTEYTATERGAST